MSLVADSPETRATEAVIALGLVPPITLDQARARYRELAKIYHPDAGRFADAAMFARLNDAMRTVEEHADLVTRGTLSWRSGGAGSASARLLDELNQAQRALIEKEGELSRLALENRHLAQTSSKRGKRPEFNPIVLFPIFILLLAATAVGTILLRSQDGMTFPLAPFSIEIPGGAFTCTHGGTEMVVSLSPSRVEVSTASLQIRGNQAVVLNHQTTTQTAEIIADPRYPVVTTATVESVPIYVAATMLKDPVRYPDRHGYASFTSGTVYLENIELTFENGQLKNESLLGSTLTAYPVVELKPLSQQPDGLTAARAREAMELGVRPNY